MVGREKSVKGRPDEHHLHHDGAICYTFTHHKNHVRVTVARYQKAMLSPSSLPLLTPTPPYVTLGTSGGGILGCEKSTSISSLCSGHSCPVAFRLLMRTLTETWFFYLKVISDCLLLLLIFITARARLLFAPPQCFQTG